MGVGGGCGQVVRGSSWGGIELSPWLLAPLFNVAASEAREASCLTLNASRQLGKIGSFTMFQWLEWAAEGHRELGCLLQFGWQHLFLSGGTVKHCFTLEMGKGHLSDRWTNTCVNDPMEFEASKVSRRLGVLRVSDVLRGLHIQEQDWHPWERNHLTTLLDLYEDDFGASSLVTCLGWRGKL